MTGVIHAVHSLNPAGGGVAQAVRQFAHAQEARGTATLTLCLDAPDAPWLAGWPGAVRGLGPAGSFGWSPALDGALASPGPVIAHGMWDYPALAALRRLRRGHGPYFLFPHGMLDPWFLRGGIGTLRKRLYWAVAGRSIARHAARVLFTCAGERQLAEASWRPWPGRSAIAPLGLTPPPAPGPDDALRVSRLCGGLAGRPYLLFLARLHPKKGGDILLRALAFAGPGAPPVVFAGTGPAGVEWQALARTLGLREGVHVHWAGQVEGADKWALLRGASALILPSHQENFGFVVAEALACSRPVFLTRAVNIHAEVVEAGAGWADDDSVAGIARLLEAFTSASPESLSRAGSLGAGLFTSAFAAPAAAARLDALIAGAT